MTDVQAGSEISSELGEHSSLPSFEKSSGLTGMYQHKLFFIVITQFSYQHHCSQVNILGPIIAINSYPSLLLQYTQSGYTYKVIITYPQGGLNNNIHIMK